MHQQTSTISGSARPKLFAYPLNGTDCSVTKHYPDFHDHRFAVITTLNIIFFSLIIIVLWFPFLYFSFFLENHLCNVMDDFNGIFILPLIQCLWRHRNVHLASSAPSIVNFSLWISWSLSAFAKICISIIQTNNKTDFCLCRFLCDNLTNLRNSLSYALLYSSFKPLWNDIFRCFTDPGNRISVIYCSIETKFVSSGCISSQILNSRKRWSGHF